MSHLHEFGPAFFEFLALRKRYFVDQLNWDVPHDDRLEMDQYDNPTAFYSLVMHEGSVIAGARATPTNAVWGDSSYMLRDAALGKIGGIPSNLVDRRLCSASVWECTRLVIDDSLTTADDRPMCLYLIVRGLADMASENGATRLISLSPITLMRSLRQLGFGAERFSDSYASAEDRRQYAVLTMPAQVQPESQLANAA